MRDELELRLPAGWALDGLKPVFGAEWEVELREAAHDREVHVSLGAASAAAVLQAARACATWVLAGLAATGAQVPPKRRSA